MTTDFPTFNPQPQSTAMNIDFPGPNRKIFEPPLSVQRYKWVQDFITNRADVFSITDFGCGNGRILNWLKPIPHIGTINCLDSDRVMLDFEIDNYFRPGIYEMLFGRQGSMRPLNIRVFHGDLTIPDERLSSDCFLMVEVIEHMLPEDVERATRIIFGYYKPKLVVITTPNREFNHLLRQEDESEDKFRHFDHKFEWNRMQFNQYCQEICDRYQYMVMFDGVGHLPGSDPFGPCTQIAVFQFDENHRTNCPNKDLLCFDMLLDKLTVRDSVPDWDYDPSQRKISLIAEFTLPGLKSDLKPTDVQPYDWTSDDVELTSEVSPT